MIGVHGVDVALLRAAWWTLHAVRRTRRRLARLGFDAALEVPPPPRLPRNALRGVNAAMRYLGTSCLERAIVLQAWHGAQGDNRDLIIGVSPRQDGFRAHAWIDGEEPWHAQTAYYELLRRPNLRDAPPRNDGIFIEQVE